MPRAEALTPRRSLCNHFSPRGLPNKVIRNNAALVDPHRGRSLAAELGPYGIGVNTMVPMNVDTVMFHNPETYALPVS